MNPLAHPLVLVNPAAGRGRSLQVRKAVESYWRQQGVPAEFRAAGSPEEVRAMSREARGAGYSSVVALGGDGTVHEVINGAAGTSAVVGVLPAGGGNDLARALGLPFDPLEAAHAVLHARPRRMDLLRLRAAGGRECLYAGAGGMGLDAEAAQLANTRFRRVPGAVRYVVAAIAAFREARPLAVRLPADGDFHEFSAHLVAVANTPSYGSGVRIAPAARIDDGWMDLAIVAPLRWSQVLDGLLLALRDGDIRWPEMRRMRARKVRLETDRPVIFHGDGEVLGETPVEIEVLPGHLEILAPPGG
jgi:diacylglycerol kinase (ATP)